VISYAYHDLFNPLSGHYKIFSYLKISLIIWVYKVQRYDRVKAVLVDYDKQEGLESAFKDVEKLFLLTHPPRTAEHESTLVNEAKKI
jgi:hypothetical protein